MLKREEDALCVEFALHPFEKTIPKKFNAKKKFDDQPFENVLETVLEL